VVSKLDLLGFSGVANLLSAVKMAKWYELTDEDVVLTVFTDSMELYGSRLHEMNEEMGEYSSFDAVRDYHRWMMGMTTDATLELGYPDRKRIHNLKYYTTPGLNSRVKRMKKFRHSGMTLITGWKFNHRYQKLMR